MKKLLYTICIIFTLSCSDNDADTITNREKCENFIDKLCKHEMSCGTYRFPSECMFNIKKIHNLNCNNVIAISSNYNACMEDLYYIKCSDVILPLSCHRVLIYE